MSDNTWDGKISNMKISERSFPELYKELSVIQHRERSDRLRSLALIGLLCLSNSNGGGLALQKASSNQSGKEPSSDAVLSKKKSLANKLRMSV